jgi:cytochrome P450
MYKEPKVFRPERFMPDGEFDQFDDEIRTFMFVPFIAGPRNCLGQHLALLEARVVLSALVKNFKFRNATDVPPLRSPTVIPVAPVGGMNFYLE